MAKRTTKNFSIQRRVTVWIGLTVAAKDFDDAVVQAKEMTPWDWVEGAAADSRNAHLDSEFAGGLGVIED